MISAPPLGETAMSPVIVDCGTVEIPVFVRIAYFSAVPSSTGGSTAFAESKEARKRTRWQDLERSIVRSDCFSNLYTLNCYFVSFTKSFM